MKLLVLAGFLSLSMAVAWNAHADDCAAKLTAQEQATFASLPPADQQTLMNFKMRNGSPASCEFRAGLLDMLGNDEPEKRSEAFHYLLNNTLVRQK
ncbi:MAG TPA: hypothetical protein VMF50_04355 [Candidatus Binataceae bacterium]|nr:hypothetical protein [Candidatus Binataceae bacterium]